jgi:hypothetical protein
MLHGLVTRGSTPTHFFELPFSTQELSDACITYAAETMEPIDFYLSDCRVKDKYIIIDLTQENTLSFPEGEVVEVQIKVLTKSNKVFVSPTYRLGIEKVLNGRVMQK